MRDDSLERGPAERTRASENRPTGKKGVTNGGIKLVKDDEKCRKKAWIVEAQVTDIYGRANSW